VAGRHRKSRLDGCVALKPSLEHPLADTCFRGSEVVGEVLNHVGTGVESHNRDPVALAQFAERRVCGFGYTCDHRAHAGAGVEQQNDVERLLFMAEVHNVPGPSAIRYPEALPRQIVDRATYRSDLGVQTDQSDIAAKNRLVLNEQPQQKKSARHGPRDAIRVPTAL
jgi:hypothetical protein